MKNSTTCLTCSLNKCDVRGKCPDDETTTEKRKQEYAEWPQI